MCDSNCAPPLVGQSPSVCILSGSFGEGHDAAAREIQRRLADHGIDSVVLDIVDRYPLHAGRAIKALYLWQIKTMPRTWGWLLTWLGADRHGLFGLRLGQRFALGLVGSAARQLRSVPAMYDAVLSTHPFASQVLGRLDDHSGRTHRPTFTYLTDLSVHPLWVSAGIDRHLALHEVAAIEARNLGARSVDVVRPAIRSVASAPMDSATRARHRTALALPAVGQVVAVTGGAEGVGALEQTARDLLAVDGVTPVVLCGRNDGLRQRLNDVPGVVALGWVDDMAGLYTAVDVVVQNAGGSTSLEALGAGLPVLSYRCLPGHGTTNAANLERAGLAPWIRTPEDLSTELDRLRMGGQAPSQVTRHRCVADVIADALRPTDARLAG